jgi:hypothetical protein
MIEPEQAPHARAYPKPPKAGEWLAYDGEPGAYRFIAIQPGVNTLEVELQLEQNDRITRIVMGDAKCNEILRSLRAERIREMAESMRRA